MDAIIEAVSNGFKYITFIRLSDVIDILIIAFLIYKAFGLIRKTNTLRVAKGIIVLVVLLWLSGVLNLSMINFLLQNTFELGFIALVISFSLSFADFLRKSAPAVFRHLLAMTSSHLKLITPLLRPFLPARICLIKRPVLL